MFGFGKKDKEIAALKLIIDEMDEASEVDNRAKEELIVRTSELQNEINQKAVQLVKAQERIKELETITNGLTDHNARLDNQSKHLVGAVHRAEEKSATLESRVRELELKVSIQTAKMFAKRKSNKKSKPKKKAKR